MTPSKNNIIQSTFRLAVAQPSNFSRAFLTKLFHREPTLRRLFPVGHEPRDAVIVALLSSLVSAVGDEGTLANLAESIAAQMVQAQIQPRHYGAIGQALLAALEARLGSGFTEEVHDAWADAYVQVAEAVMAARYNPMELVA